MTGNPLFEDDYPTYNDIKNKKHQIIISNRFDWEKRPNVSLQFAYILKKRNPELKIIVTTSRPSFKSNKLWLVDLARDMEEDGIIEIHEGLSKAEYHKMLSESKVMLSNSIEENFGYCIAEALVYNTYPMLKNELSHPELVFGDPRMLFDDEDEIVHKVEALLVSNFPVRHYAEKYFRSLSRIISIMNEDRVKEVTF